MLHQLRIALQKVAIEICYRSIYRSFFQLVGDLEELKKKDYPEIKKLTLGDKKVSKGIIQSTFDCTSSRAYCTAHTI